MGSIFSSTSLPREEQKEDGWVIVDEEEALAEAKVEEEEEEEETEAQLQAWERIAQQYGLKNEY